MVSPPFYINAGALQFGMHVRADIIVKPAQNLRPAIKLHGLDAEGRGKSTQTRSRYNRSQPPPRVAARSPRRKRIVRRDRVSLVPERIERPLTAARQSSPPECRSAPYQHVPDFNSRTLCGSMISARSSKICTPDMLVFDV